MGGGGGAAACALDQIAAEQSRGGRCSCIAKNSNANLVKAVGSGGSWRLAVSMVGGRLSAEVAALLHGKL